ncbi:hypothetical protein [Parerythrobacter aestuarii]|uniref:hypothetical protein n=1 Tax=Parerythrobacter aestuarii TaxID=3020909 RepID=UPI0024DF06D6|nr:hypothetical protein [Parerythrobacter aestuarii]
MVVLDQGKLSHWQIATSGYQSDSKMRLLTISLLCDHRPNVVVTEKLDRHCRKGPKAKALIGVIHDATYEANILLVPTNRAHEFVNKYAEAEALVARYPELTPWLPQREKFYDNEPRNTVLFEALSMTEKVMRGSSTTLAAALG